MSRYQKTKFTGVFAQESATARFNGRPDVTWYIIYQVGGKGKWEKIGRLSDGYTAAMAARIRGERIREHDGRVRETPSLTFAEAFGMAYERHLKLLSGARSSENRYRVHLADKLGPLAISAIGSEDVDAIKRHLLQIGRAPATVRQVIGLVGRVYNLMAEWGLYRGGNPAEHVIVPRADNRRTRYLTHEEAARLMAELQKRSPYAYRLAMTSLCTGMRAGEVISLRGEHVNLAAATIRVVDTKSRRDRTVYIGAALKAMLETIEIVPGRLVFVPPKGGSRQRVGRVYDTAVEALGLNKGITDRRDRVVFHTLRHTFASWLASRGVSLYVIQMLLGHSSPAMTQRYAHLAPSIQREAIGAIDEACHF